jgi:hypothetical protein
MNTYKIQGKFLGKSPIKTVEGKSTRYRSFWLDCTDNPEFPNTPEFNLLNDKCDLVENIKPGDYMNVQFNINGRKWEKTDDNGFVKKGVNTTLSVWKLELIQYTAPTPVSTGETSGDDLPF